MAAKIVIIFGFAITFGFICCCKVIGAHQLPMTDATTPRIAHKTLRRGTNGSILWQIWTRRRVLELKSCVVSLFIRTVADESCAVGGRGAFSVPADEEDVAGAVCFFYDDLGTVVIKCFPGIIILTGVVA